MAMRRDGGVGRGVKTSNWSEGNCDKKTSAELSKEKRGHPQTALAPVPPTLTPSWEGQCRTPMP